MPGLECLQVLWDAHKCYGMPPSVFKWCETEVPGNGCCALCSESVSMSKRLLGLWGKDLITNRVAITWEHFCIFWNIFDQNMRCFVIISKLSQIMQF